MTSAKDKAVLRKMAQDNARYMALRKRADMTRRRGEKQAGLEEYE